jgi:hypothetical protein
MEPEAGSSESLSVADYSEWQAQDYFRTYYSEVVLPDEQAVLAYQIETLRRAGRQFGRGLEYGCGPTLHRAIAAARYTFRLDMADWLPDNLGEVRSWLDGGAENTDWNRFTRYILECESAGPPEPQRVARREELTRKVVRNLYVSDARWRHPLGPERVGYYDLIVSGFCIDAISSDKRIWQRCMRNLLSTLQSGGLVIVHALHRCKAYRVGERHFPGADLSRDELAESLLDNGCDPRTVEVQVVPCPSNAAYGYTGILVASAVKAL